MLDALIRFSLRHRPLVLAVAVLLLVLGWQAARDSALDVLPELTKPVVTVLTEAPTLAPEEVETRVTRPIETALLGLPGLDRVRSNSDSGLSVVYAEFAWGSDLRASRLLVQERLLSTTRLLPEGTAPGLAPATSLLGEIMLIGLSSTDEKRTPAELRTLADTTIRRRLQSVPGVADVLAVGGGVQQIHILPDPRKLSAHQLTMQEVQEAVAHATGNATSGVMNLNSREMAVRTLGLSTDLADLRRTPVIIEEDHVVLLGDIARVEMGTQLLRGEASVNGRPGVILSVDKSPGADTLRVTAGVERALQDLRTTLPAGTEFTPLFRQADFIETSLRHLRAAVRDGSLIVAAVLLLFLLNLRTTLITLTAIPLSFAIALLVFRGLGVTVNAMTLGGLAVAIGMVVDDAIVDVENVFRRWRENVQLPQPRPLLELVARASSEVRNSILYATILVLLTFLPLTALPALEGQLFAPVAITTCVSISASFLVSLTIIPVLGSFLLPRKKERAARADGFIVRMLKSFVGRRVVPFALHRPFVVLTLTAIALAAGIALTAGVRRGFLPAFHESSATVSLISAPGTSLHSSSQLGETAVRLLQRIPEIRSVGRRTGRAERDDHVVPVSISEFDLEVHESGRPRAVVNEEIRRALGGIPGAFVNVGAPLAHRLAHMLSGTSARLAIKLFTPDLDEGYRLAERIAGVAREQPGLIDVLVEPQAMVAQVAVEVDRERALAYGLQVVAVSEQVTELLSGRIVARVPHEEQTLELLVRLPSEWTDTPEELDRVHIRTPSGALVPLHALATVREVTGPSVINRDNAQRRVLVTANTSGGDWPTLIRRLETEVREKVPLPPGAFLSFEGEYLAQQAAMHRIALLAAIVLLVLALLLYSYFRSAALAAQVLVNIPLALLGGLLLTRLMSDEINVATLVGFIAIGGVAARNGILMLSHYLHLLRHEGETFTRAMVIRGTLDRLPPVLMTALSAALALLPLVLARDDAGKELLHPVAVVIVGGLLSSTLLDFLVTPAVFFHFGRPGAERALAQDAPAAR